MKFLSGIVSVVILVLSSGIAFAAEGGGNFYLLGQRAQGAAVLPPEGVFVVVPNYFYSGNMSDSANLPLGASLALNVDADLFLSLPTAVWVTPVDILGGDLALKATFVVGNADLKATSTLAIPGLGTAAASISDERWSAGDPSIGAMVGWQADNANYLLSASINIPAGDYDTGRLANISLNRWAWDITGAATWLHPESGIELSGATGITFNGENDDTKYETGTELHIEAATVKHFSETFSAGVNGYYYHQLTADSGSGATLGDFEGRVVALGPMMAATFTLAEVPIATSLQYYHEFNVDNRPVGDAGWLTITIPLWVPTP